MHAQYVRLREMFDHQLAFTFLYTFVEFVLA
jgi:hypothetical protein